MWEMFKKIKKSFAITLSPLKKMRCCATTHYILGLKTSGSTQLLLSIQISKWVAMFRQRHLSLVHPCNLQCLAYNQDSIKWLLNGWQKKMGNWRTSIECLTIFSSLVTPTHSLRLPTKDHLLCVHVFCWYLTYP